MIQPGLIASLSPFRKIFFFGLLAFASLLFFTSLASFAGTVIFSRNLAELFMGLDNYDQPENIVFLKYLQVISQIGLFILPPLLFAWLADGNISGYLRMNRRVGLLTLVLCLLVLLSSLPFVQWMYELNQLLNLPVWLDWLEGWMKQSEANAERLTKAFLEVETIGGFMVNLLMIAILPALGEELVFRGVLQRLFNEWFKNHHLAIFASAIIFSSLHMQFYGFLPRTALGVIFGYLFVVSGSLWVPVLVHFVNNALAVFIAFFFRKGMVDNDYMDIGKVSGFWWVLASLVLVVLLFYSLSQHLKIYPPKVRHDKTTNENEN